MLILLASTGVAHAAPYDLDPAKSFFTIVTHKQGVGSGLAHDHIIGTTAVQAKINADPKQIAATDFEVSFNVKDLKVDDPAYVPKVIDMITSKKILEKKPADVSEGDRKTITEDMLADEQLDAKKHPQIKARLLKLVPAPPGDPSITHMATVSLTIKGKSVDKEFKAEIKPTGDNISVKAWGAAKFTEFGIEPVSLFFGAIRNGDEFDILVHFEARKAKAS